MLGVYIRYRLCLRCRSALIVTKSLGHIEKAKETEGGYPSGLLTRPDMSRDTDDMKAVTGLT